MTQKKMSIRDFGKEHKLKLKIDERPANLIKSGLERFYVAFEGLVEIKNSDGTLLSTRGDGNTKKEAIADYAKEMSNQKIIISANGKKRRKIFSPILTP